MTSTDPAPAGRRPVPALLVATGLGCGRLRPGPGTWASLLATAAALAAIRVLPVGAVVPALVGGVLVAVLLGLWAIGPTCRHLGSTDPGAVVIDEIAGVWLALACCTEVELRAWPPLLPIAAFLAFRVLDILKPWPLRRLERLPGALGVMADDLAAGLVAGIACRLLTALARA